ncbi:PREDICTED: protein PIN-LIKES 3-like [Ipomoea nil]|uniref:protein PIN-LIKES 3-like n=1 Tax=Ipomoea nil TaxID=35883 RepID=UPI000901CB29|nr:PREDICTED: protein PIN-LIKES 3-like [Ipomoea nil]XP_019177392.1 PREDICTED: protein PIN-LIKES 3-like [Ipomoea nil]
MGIRELFLVALMPVLKTLFIAIVGLFLALDRVSILSAPARHHLNNLVFYIFFPALLASSLVDSMTATSIVSLWFIPVSILITFIIGSALGWILVKITRAPRELHGLVIGCCAAGNMGNLPVIIIPAICAEKNNPFGDSSTCSKNGMSYVALSMGIGAVFVWSYVYNIVRACGNNNIPTDAKVDSRISEKQHDETLGITLDNNCTEALLLSNNYLSSGGNEDLERSTREVQVPVLGKIKQQVKTWMGNIELKMIFRPPTIATILGIIIGVISPIRNIMVGESAPLRFVESSVVLLGDAAIPSMTLIMGANLLRGFKRSGVGLWLLVGIIIVRFIALPVVGIVVIKAARDLGMVGSDPLYHFVLLLQYSVPPAMAIGTITQLFEIGETECSVIMFWNYGVASVALTLWSTYFMWFLS